MDAPHLTVAIVEALACRPSTTAANQGRCGRAAARATRCPGASGCRCACASFPHLPGMVEHLGDVLRDGQQRQQVINNIRSTIGRRGAGQRLPVPQHTFGRQDELAIELQARPRRRHRDSATSVPARRRTRRFPRPLAQTGAGSRFRRDDPSSPATPTNPVRESATPSAARRRRACCRQSGRTRPRAAPRCRRRSERRGQHPSARCVAGAGHQHRRPP